MEISFPFVACVRTAGRKKICQIVAVQFLQGGLGPFRGLDAPRAPKTNDNPDLRPSQQPSGHSAHGTGSARLAAHIVPEQNHASDVQFIRRFKQARVLRHRPARLATICRFSVTKRRSGRLTGYSEGGPNGDSRLGPTPAAAHCLCVDEHAQLRHGRLPRGAIRGSSADRNSPFD